MWVRKTQEELVATRWTQKRKRFIAWIPFWLSLSLLFAAFRGPHDRSGSPGLVSFDEFLHRLPMAALFLAAGIFIGTIFGWLPNRKTVVCPDCGAAKTADGSPVCQCGGKLVDIDEMKWIGSNDSAA